MRNLRNLNQCEFHEQTLVRRLPVVDIALVHETQGLIEEAGFTGLGLLCIALALLVADLKERQRLRILGHQHVAYVLGKTLDEQSAIETFVDDIVEQHHDVAHFILIG